MVKYALGLIEIVGLAAALAAADAAVKAANIKLIGYELTKGGGWVVVKLCGDVGAVKAAVEAGRIAGSKVNKVWATHVIPRPHQQLSCILAAEENIARQDQPEAPMSIDIPAVSTEGEIIEKNETQLEAQPEREDDEIVEVPHSELNNEPLECHDVSVTTKQEKKPADRCNLCNDPACQRRKGDPKITCMYYGKNNKEAE